MEKIWLKSYEAGVNAEIDPAHYTSMIDVVQQSVTKFGDQTAFYSMGKELSYRQIGELSDHFASYLQNVLKLPRGERVAVMMPNLLQYPIAVFGILKAGLVVVNTNPLYTPRELEHQLNDSGASTIVVLENFANTLELVLPRTQIKNIIIASVGEMFGAIKGTLMNFVLRHVKKAVPSYQLAGTTSFQAASSASSVSFNLRSISSASKAWAISSKRLSRRHAIWLAPHCPSVQLSQTHVLNT